jgi:hypothetical protein
VSRTSGRGGVDNYPPPVVALNEQMYVDARNYIVRTGNTDVLEALGLADPDTTQPGRCKHCTEPLPMSQAASRGKNRFRGYCNARCAGAAGHAKAHATTN